MFDESLIYSLGGSVGESDGALGNESVVGLLLPLGSGSLDLSGSVMCDSLIGSAVLDCSIGLTIVSF